MSEIKKAYSFNDVLLIPGYSSILPENANLKTNITKNISLNVPFISAAMDSVTESKMAIAMAVNGGIGAIHKNMSIDEQYNQVKKVKNFKIDEADKATACCDNEGRLRTLAAIGVNEQDIERARALISAGVDGIILDTSHGHSENVISSVKNLREKFSFLEIIAGNVATYNAAIELIYAGANSIKVGIGPGSICTTRIVTGVGMPQFSAIKEVARACAAQDAFLIADGGIKYSGDIAKAIGAGADCVMIGSIIAGTDESCAKTVTIDGKKYKAYRGMGSINAMQKGSADRYFQKSVDNLVPQGVEGYIKHSGKLKYILHQLKGGLASAMGYTGNPDIAKMKTNSSFIRVTNSGAAEGHVHSLAFFNETKNYSK